MKDFTQENIDYLNQYAIDNGGLEYAELSMKDFKEKAIRELDDFEDNSWKQALIHCAEFAVSRKK
jgi:geranylgeranyl pyrophosphate synthase